jgi:hydrogenase/urease accessory protein HupE
MTLSEEKINMRYTVFFVGGFNLEGFEWAVKIFVVLIGLVLIFKKQLVSLVNSLMEKVTNQSNTV